MLPIDCRTSEIRNNKQVSYDLSPLINHNRNWVVTDGREGGKFEYEVNVCRPLVPNRNWTYV